MDHIWDVHLTDIQLLEKFIKNAGSLLSLIDIYSKYA